MPDSLSYLILACLLVVVLVMTITSRHVRLPNGVMVQARDVRALRRTKQAGGNRFYVTMQDDTFVAGDCTDTEYIRLTAELLFKSCLP